MKANELRIGNYVYHDALKIPRLGIDGVDYMQITGEGISCFEQKLMDVIPIPLTEEWLLKFGFETWETEVSLQIYDFWQLYNLKIAIYKGNFYTDINAKKIFIKHVHQLQNLYFALTSEELTIKL